MKCFGRSRYLAAALLVLLNSCTVESPQQISPVVTGIPADIQSLNPLFAFSGYETILSELLYPALVKYEWNNGRLDFFPMLAEKWEWNSDSSSILFYLRKDVNWRDGEQVTAEDVIFSLDCYSDPNVQSRLFGTFDHFYIDDDLHINIDKTFESSSPYLLKVNFSRKGASDLRYFDMPLIPEHIFGKMERPNLVTAEKGNDTVTCGAFYLAGWEKNQSIIFNADSQPFIEERGNVNQLIFKIIPDYNSRLVQLKNGEIDLMEDIKTEDIEELKKKNLETDAVKGKEYDYTGWNNILPESFSDGGRLLPNPLFGNPEVRRALTYAINREEIFEEFLLSHGSLAAGPVSPIFGNYFNKDLLPMENSYEKAAALLEKNGWKDSNHNGTIDKNGKEFSFILNIPTGNPRREYAAVIIKNNLRRVGIEVKVEPLEPGVFFDRMFSRNLNAWIAGWVVPIPLELYPFWYSDPEKAPLNVTSYKNGRVDSLLNLISGDISEDLKADYIKQIQTILYYDQPVTFMYWIDNIYAYNPRLENVSATPLGPFHHCWKWSVK